MRIVAPIQKNPASKAKFAEKLTSFFRGDFTPFMSKSFQIWDPFFSLLSSNDSEYLKSLYIGLQEEGAKRLLNGVRKCDGQPDN